VYLLHSLRLTLFFFPRLSSLLLAPPRALMKDGTWTCALLSGRYFNTRLVTLGVSADYQTQQLGSWVTVLRVLFEGHVLLQLARLLFAPLLVAC